MIKNMSSLLIALIISAIVFPISAEASKKVYTVDIHSETIREAGKGRQELEIKEINTGEIRNVTVGPSGISVGLKEGNYEMRTTKITSGLETLDEPVRFNVPFISKEGQILTGYRIELKVEEIFKDIVIVKRDKDTGKRLEGAIFNLYKIEDGVKRVVSERLVTDRDGLIKIFDVSFGDYELFEKTAPKGYFGLKEGYRFTIDERSRDIVEITVYNSKDSPTDPPIDPPKIDTPTDTPTDTPVDTPTDTPVDTPTDTPVDTPVDTPTDTPVDTPVDTPTDTPTDTPDEFKQTSTAAIGMGMFAFVGLLGGLIALTKRND